jgi:hypothetical protein
MVKSNKKLNKTHKSKKINKQKISKTQSINSDKEYFSSLDKDEKQQLAKFKKNG